MSQRLCLRSPGFVRPRSFGRWSGVGSVVVAWSRDMVPVEDLIALFAGDELTSGVPSVYLAARICEQVCPRSESEMVELIFGARVLSYREERAVHDAFEAWVNAGKPQAA